MSESDFVLWDGYEEKAPDTMHERAQAFAASMQTRRSVRDFSERPVPRSIMEHAIAAAGTAPSGANKQPWFFAVVADPERKQAIRAAAEACERQFYKTIQDTQWEKALEPLGTGIEKPFLTQAPYLVVVFAQRHGLDAEGEIEKHYYVSESVGLAVGFFLTAVHEAGLASLVYTPAPMAFLNTLLERPDNERPFCICPVGYPAPEAMVPNQSRKPLGKIMTWY
jgi:iodotyrosine deiodinase